MPYHDKWGGSGTIPCHQRTIVFMLKTSNKRKQTKTGYKSSLANWWKKVEDSIHIKKAIVYKQLFEFKSNLDSHMIRNLKSSNSELTRFCARIKKKGERQWLKVFNKRKKFKLDNKNKWGALLWNNKNKAFQVYLKFLCRGQQLDKKQKDVVKERKAAASIILHKAKRQRIYLFIQNPSIKN